MAELTTSPTTFPLTNDTWAGLTPGTTEIMAEAINGLASGLLALEGFSANTASSLKTRLDASFSPTGGVARGVAFPVSPTPIDGQLFILIDTLHGYNAGTAQWETLIKIPTGAITGSMLALATITGANIAPLTIGDAHLITPLAKASLPAAIAYEDEVNVFTMGQQWPATSLFLAENAVSNQGGKFSMERALGSVLVSPPATHYMSGDTMVDAIGTPRLEWGLTAGTGGVARLITGEIPLVNLLAGPLPAGITVPLTNLSAGPLPAAVTVPLANLSAGALPVAVTVAPTNLSAGALPVTVSVSADSLFDIAEFSSATPNPVSNPSGYQNPGPHNVSLGAVAVPSVLAADYVLVSWGFPFRWAGSASSTVYCNMDVILTGSAVARPFGLNAVTNGSRVSSRLLGETSAGTVEHGMSGTFMVRVISGGALNIVFDFNITDWNGSGTYQFQPLDGFHATAMVMRV